MCFVALRLKEKDLVLEVMLNIPSVFCTELALSQQLNDTATILPENRGAHSRSYSFYLCMNRVNPRLPSTLL